MRHGVVLEHLLNILAVYRSTRQSSHVGRADPVYMPASNSSGGSNTARVQTFAFTCRRLPLPVLMFQAGERMDAKRKRQSKWSRWAECTLVSMLLALRLLLVLFIV